MRRTGEPAPASAPGADREPTPDLGVGRAEAIGPGFDPVSAPVPGVERPLASGRGSRVLMTTVPGGESPPRTPFPVRGEHAPPPDFGVDRVVTIGSGFVCAPTPVAVSDHPPTSVRRALVLATEVPSGKNAPKALVPVCGDLAPEATSPVCGERPPGTLVPICADRARKTGDRSSEFASSVCSEGAPKSSDPGGNRAPTTTSAPVGGESQVSLDRLSTLPDDILLLVLLRLPIDEAVRTSVLAPRWRSLWTQLRTLVFREEPAAQARRFQDLVHGALARHADGSLDNLFIELVKRPGTDFGRVATWLHAAAAAFKSLLALIAWRPTSVRLPIQSFSRLRRLVLIGARFTEAGTDPFFVISSQCPKLEVLEAANLFGISKLRIKCDMLLELRLGWIDDFSTLEIVAPKLHKMLIIECSSSILHSSLASITAPNLKIIDWQASCSCEKIASTRIEKFRFSLRDVDFAMPFLESFNYVNCIDIVVYEAVSKEAIKKEIEEYKLPDHSELKISFEPNGPEFNAKINVMDDEESDSMDQDREDKERQTG